MSKKIFRADFDCGVTRKKINRIYNMIKDNPKASKVKLSIIFECGDVKEQHFFIILIELLKQKGILCNIKILAEANTSYKEREGTPVK